MPLTRAVTGFTAWQQSITFSMTITHRTHAFQLDYMSKPIFKHFDPD